MYSNIFPPVTELLPITLTFELGIAEFQDEPASKMSGSV